MLQVDKQNIKNFCAKFRKILTESTVHECSKSSNYSPNYTWLEPYLQVFFNVKKSFEKDCIDVSSKSVNSMQILVYLSDKIESFSSEQWARIFLQSGYSYMQTGSYENTAEILKTVLLEDNFPIELSSLIACMPEKISMLSDIKHYFGNTLYSRAEMFKYLQKQVDLYVVKHRKLPDSLELMLFENDAVRFSHMTTQWVMLENSGEIVTKEAVKRRYLEIERSYCFSVVTPYIVQNFEDPSDIIGELRVRVPSQQTENI